MTISQPASQIYQLQTSLDTSQSCCLTQHLFDLALFVNFRPFSCFLAFPLFHNINSKVKFLQSLYKPFFTILLHFSNLTILLHFSNFTILLHFSNFTQPSASSTRRVEFKRSQNQQTANRAVMKFTFFYLSCVLAF